MELSKLMGCVKRPFIPSELFRGGLIDGAWFDPSDMSTLYQDAAGTTPVTAVEQPVGLMLDKARGMMLGPELVSNGTFDRSTSGWGLTAPATISAQNGELVLTNTTNGYQEQANYELTPFVSSGRMYKVSMMVRLGTATSYAAIVDGSSVSIAYRPGYTNTEYQLLSFYFTYPATQTSCTLRIRATGIGTVFADNISVKELYGYHATQPITASRPTLSARYNLLTKTEDFSDAVWTKANSTNPTYPPVVTPDAAIGPDGITYADLVTPANIAGCSFIEVYQNSTIISGTKYHQYYCVKPNGWRYLQSVGNWAVFSFGYVNFDLVTGTVTANAPDTGGFSGDITPLANGWFLLHVSATAIANGTSHLSINFIDSATASRGQVATGNGVDGVYVTRGDFRAAAEQNSYQSVNTSTDYDTDERYFPKYLSFDGIDDYLSLPYMGLYAAGACSIVVAMSENKVAYETTLINETNSTLTAPMYNPTRQSDIGNNWRSLIRNDANVVTLSSTGALINADGHISVRSRIERESNTAAFENSINKESYNYARAGTLTLDKTTIGALLLGGVMGSPDNMNLYGLIITKSALTDSQRVACERFEARKSGVLM